MICKECGKEMKEGYLFSTKDGAFSFASSVPSAFESAKTARGYIKITEAKVGGRTSVKAYCCNFCKTILLHF